MAWSSPASVGTPNPWEGPPLLGHDAAYQTLLTPSPQPRCLTHVSPQAVTLQAPQIRSWQLSYLIAPIALPPRGSLLWGHTPAPPLFLLSAGLLLQGFCLCCSFRLEHSSLDTHCLTPSLHPDLGAPVILSERPSDHKGKLGPHPPPPHSDPRLPSTSHQLISCSS